MLLKQLPSGWNPPVIEVFDALMRRGEGGEEAGKQLYDGTRLVHRASHAQPQTPHPAPLHPPLLRYKSDIKQLVDQIHKELRKVGQTVGVGEASGRRSGGHAPSELVDFLSSVCVTDNRGHEDVQCWVAQLMCGLVSEGVDPHNSSLIYHLRLLADKGADGRLKATSVQISTATLGKLRPAYRHDAEREPDEEDETYARDASN